MQGIQGSPGVDGEDGKTAYEIWLDSGNTGTQEQFLASLQGQPGPEGPPGPGLQWILVGADQSAEPNTGYLVTAPFPAPPAVVTLPVGRGLVSGEVFRVTGARLGWKIALSDSEDVIVGDGFYTGNFLWRAATRPWPTFTTSVTTASSADGSRLAVAASNNQIYTSSDGGAYWVARDSVRLWKAVASSADGSRLVAAADNEGLFISTNEGESWTRVYSHDANSWAGVASSSDGRYLVAVQASGYIYTSDDYGTNWTQRGQSGTWWCVASSPDGRTQIAVMDTLGGSGTLYRSSNFGLDWEPVFHSLDIYLWNSLAWSADGTRVFAATMTGLYASEGRFAEVWTRILAPDDPYGWRGVACSADGSRIVAVSRMSFQTSADYGATWTAHPVGDSVGCSSSSDGRHIVTASADTIWTGTAAAASLSGGRGTSAELQYLGDGLFLLLSSTGAVRAE